MFCICCCHLSYNKLIKDRQIQTLKKHDQKSFEKIYRQNKQVILHHFIPPQYSF